MSTRRSVPCASTQRPAGSKVAKHKRCSLLGNSRRLSSLAGDCPPLPMDGDFGMKIARARVVVPLELDWDDALECSEPEVASWWGLVDGVI